MSEGLLSIQASSPFGISPFAALNEELRRSLVIRVLPVPPPELPQMPLQLELNPPELMQEMVALDRGLDVRQ